jgi:hypothetical protein
MHVVVQLSHRTNNLRSRVNVIAGCGCALLLVAARTYKVVVHSPNQS